MVREVRSLNRSERALSTSQFFRRTSSVHIGHVPKLRELFVALERASAAREQSIYSVSRSLEQAADGRRTLTIDQEIILNEIQGLPGFERFLVQKEFHELGAATHLGPWSSSTQWRLTRLDGRRRTRVAGRRAGQDSVGSGRVERR